MSKRQNMMYLAVLMLVSSFLSFVVYAPVAEAAESAPQWPEKGTVIEFTVEYTPGGGFDVVTRAIAPYIEKHLGNSNLPVVNMPGADGAVAAQYLATQKPDGKHIQLLSVPGLVVRESLSSLPFSLLKDFTLLGQTDSGKYVTSVRADSPFKTIEDVLNAKRKLTVGTAGLLDTSAITAILAYATLGIDFDIVPHPGMNDAVLAALRGDVDIVHSMSYSPAVTEGQLRVLLAYTDQPEAHISKVPLAKDKGYPQLTGKIELKRIVAAPKGLPAHIQTALEKAVWDAMNDPGFIAWGKGAGYTIEPKTPAEARQSLEDLFKLVDDNKELLQKYVTF